MRPLLALGTLLVLASPVQAQLVLGWEFPREANATGFVLTATTGTGLMTTWQVPASPVGACPGETSPDTYCTKLMQCPAPGMARYVIRAQMGTEVSAPSNEVPCTTTLQAPCRCQEAPTTPPAPPGPPPTTVIETPVASLTDTPPPEAVTPTSPTQATQVPVDLTPAPTQEVAQLPQVQSLPSLPLFQPAQSRAPV